MQFPNTHVTHQQFMNFLQKTIWRKKCSKSLIWYTINLLRVIVYLAKIIEKLMYVHYRFGDCITVNLPKLSNCSASSWFHHSNLVMNSLSSHEGFWSPSSFHSSRSGTEKWHFSHFFPLFCLQKRIWRPVHFQQSQFLCDQIKGTGWKP